MSVGGGIETAMIKETNMGNQFGFTLPKVVNLYVAQSLFKKVASLNLNGIQDIILDFSETESLKYSAYPVFVSIRLKCKEMEVGLACEKASPEIRLQVRNAGLDPVFAFRDGDVNEWLVSTAKPSPQGGPPQRLDVRAVNAFLDGSIVSAKKVFNLHCKIEKPFLKSDELFSGVGVFSVVTIDSDKIRGSVRSSMSQNFVNNLSKLHNFGELDGVSDKALSLVDEGIKLLFSVAQKNLEALGIKVSIAIPNVFVGSLIPRPGVKEKILVLPFDTQIGRFYIEIVLAT